MFVLHNSIATKIGLIYELHELFMNELADLWDLFVFWITGTSVSLRGRNEQKFKLDILIFTILMR